MSEGTVPKVYQARIDTVAVSDSTDHSREFYSGTAAAHDVLGWTRMQEYKYCTLSYPETVIPFYYSLELFHPTVLPRDSFFFFEIWYHEIVVRAI